jgi:hypothetical protein
MLLGNRPAGYPYRLNPDPIAADTRLKRKTISMRQLPRRPAATPRKRLVWSVVPVLALGAMAAALLPRGYDAGRLLLAQDDPVKLADRAVAERLTPAVAEREIAAALAAGDVDLANSFSDLSAERAIAISPELAARLDDANSTSASAVRHVGSFAHGLITGEPGDMVGLAGTALGDLFVFGDVRDAVREGVHYAKGEQVDELVLGLSCVGIAVTAGTYASLGVGAPARVGLSLVKGAGKAGRMSVHLASWVTRSVRGVVDMGALRRGLAEASLAEPALAVRVAREAVKLDKAEALVNAVRDVGRVQAKAGTQAALDSLKVAEGPRDMARFARLAEAKGGKTRAIIKLAGRAAIALTFALFDLASWLFTALFVLIGFCSAVKSTTERTTLRYLRWRKSRRWRKQMEALAEA